MTAPAARRPPAGAAADPARLAGHVRVLCGSPRSGRHHPQGIAAARGYVSGRLAADGWRVSEQQVTCRWRIGLADDRPPGGWWPLRLYRALSGVNLLAVRPGAAGGAPLVVCAHLDTVRDCPRADDNASAVAVLLEVATLLAGRDTARPVLLCVLDLEETGHFGAAAAARRITAGIRPAGVVNLEMVGYYRDEPGTQRLRRGARGLLTGPPAVLANLDGPRRGDFLAVIARRSSAHLAAAVGGASGAAGLGCVTLTDPRPEGRAGRAVMTALLPGLSNLDRSDHVPFWRRGIPAVMLVAGGPWRNPHYHRPTDVPATLDYRRLAAAAGAVAALAVDPPAPPAGRVPAGAAARRMRAWAVLAGLLYVAVLAGLGVLVWQALGGAG